jgi:hypothetical protein
MRKSYLTSVVVGALLLFGSSSLFATVITFDDLTGGTGQIPNGYAGLNWNNFWWIIGAADNPSGYTNGTVSQPNVAYNFGGNAAAFSNSNSSFTLNSGYFTAAWNDGLAITVVGMLGGIQVVGDTQTFVVNTSGPTLETFNWSGIDEVGFSSAGGVHHVGYIGSGTQFVLDNLAINEPSTVPEPSSVLLLGTGLLALIGMAWRRSSQTTVRGCV